MKTIISEYFFYYFLLFSFARFVAVMLLSNQTPVALGEKRVRLLINVGCVLDCLHLVALLILHSYLDNIIIEDFLYFTVDFKLSWTAYSVAYLVFAVALINIVARFSIFYLHRDDYFYKFFALLYVLEIAVLLLIVTTGPESLFIGWELLGISSVLLIAFYEHKPSVLKNSLTILVLYKLSDILFYSALIITTTQGKLSYLDNPSTIALALTLISCLIKSSVFPWIWLPRAMEGPTPSSAIFYGGIATHIPCFIFLNVWSSALNHNQVLVTSFIALIFISAFISSLMSKQAPDAKNAIAYASITQVGIVYIEILLGFYTLAIVHSIVNGMYRSMEFLKSPSLLYNHHTIECSRKKLVDTSGLHFERLIPRFLREKLYHLSYHEFILPRSLISIIQTYLGLHSSRMSYKSIRVYLSVSLLVFVGFEFATYNVFENKITIFDELLLLVAFAFNVFAMMYKYQPAKFFVALCASIFAIFTLLIEHINSNHTIIDALFISLVIFFGINLARTFPAGAERVNYRAATFKSDHANFLILLFGLSLVGIPGLFTFTIWEHIEDHLIHSSPDLIIDAFVIMAMNTIVFFRFYYANYLGENKNRHMYLNSFRE